MKEEFDIDILRNIVEGKKMRVVLVADDVNKGRSEIAGLQHLNAIDNSLSVKTSSTAV